MIIKELLKINIFILLTSIVCCYSEDFKGDCKLLSNIGDVKECTVNENGRITEITSITMDIFDKNITETISFDYVEKLKLEAINPTSYSNFHNVAKNLKNLKELDFFIWYTSALHYIEGVLPSEILNFSSSLKFISISGYHVNQDVIDNISKFNDLEKLRINNCWFDFTSVDKLKNLKKLNSLVMIGHNFRGDSESEVTLKVFEDILKIKSLKELIINISDAKITERLDELTNLVALYIYDESENNSKFPEKILKLKNLNKLKLYGFGFNELPKELFQIENLKELYLAGNNIETIPDNIENLKNLEVLDISYNKLSTIPDSFKNLKSLKDLDISYNKLSTIPDGFKNLKSLINLDISYNKLSTIPDSFKNLKSLKKLNLSYNSDLKGQALLLENIEHCYYYETNVCIPKNHEIKCLDDFLPYCINNNEDSISKNGQCGIGKGKCPSGQCCSKYGWCGKSDAYCLASKGCQSEFGDCKVTITTDGKCGNGKGKCPSGQCCSKYGYCGRSDAYCLKSQGCQSEFGICN